MKVTKREKILNTPEYHIEAFYGVLYNAVYNFRKSTGMSKKKISDFLGIKAYQLFDILYNGETDLKMNEVITIFVKLGYNPELKLEKMKKDVIVV